MLEELCNASAITEQKKCWELLDEKFDRFQTLHNNIQQGVQTDATCDIQQCWELLASNVASVCTGLKSLTGFKFMRNNSQQHATICIRACKRTQHVTSNNVEGCTLKVTNDKMNLSLQKLLG